MSTSRRLIRSPGITGSSYGSLSLAEQRIELRRYDQHQKELKLRKNAVYVGTIEPEKYPVYRLGKILVYRNRTPLSKKNLTKVKLEKQPDIQQGIPSGHAHSDEFTSDRMRYRDGGPMTFISPMDIHSRMPYVHPKRQY